MLFEIKGPQSQTSTRQHTQVGAVSVGVHSSSNTPIWVSRAGERLQSVRQVVDLSSEIQRKLLIHDLQLPSTRHDKPSCNFRRITWKVAVDQSKKWFQVTPPAITRRSNYCHWWRCDLVNFRICAEHNYR